MKKQTITVLGAIAFSVAAFSAQAGDPEAGASAFQSQCQNCHNVINDDGDVLAGRPNVRTGPNLYRILGRQAGIVDGFRYGASLVSAGEAGLEWDEAQMIEYLQDPQGFLRATTGDNRARSQMSFRVRDAETAENIVAFLDSLAPAEEDEEETVSN